MTSAGWSQLHPYSAPHFTVHIPSTQFTSDFFVSCQHPPPLLSRMQRFLSLVFSVVSREDDGKWSQVKFSLEVCPQTTVPSKAMWPALGCRRWAQGNASHPPHSHPPLSSQPAVARGCGFSSLSCGCPQEGKVCSQAFSCARKAEGKVPHRRGVEEVSAGSSCVQPTRMCGLPRFLGNS